MPIPNRTLTDRLVSTILTPDERIRVDAAGVGVYQTQHRSRVDQLVWDIREHGVRAIVVSVRYCEDEEQENFGLMVREIPRIPTIALLSRITDRTPGVLLRLGKHGVRKVVDVRSPQGWNELRTYLSEQFTDVFEHLALRRLHSAVPGITDECFRFFEMLFRASRTIPSVRLLARQMHLLPSTLMSRFFRIGLPAPKRYLAAVRLVRAAYLFENQGFSVANVANHLEYSSPQSFGRHVRTMMGMTAVEFRAAYSGEQMLQHFEHDLITPYVRILEEFQPISLGSCTIVKPRVSHREL